MTSVAQPQGLADRSVGLPVAAIQMVSGADLQQNLDRAEELVLQAASGGARLVALPEYFCLMGRQDHDKLAVAEAYLPAPLEASAAVQDQCPIQTRLARWAQIHGLWLVGGSIPLASPDPRRVLNTCLTYGPSGRVVHRYDKLHLFAFSNGQETYDESRSILHGQAPTVCRLGRDELALGGVDWPEAELRLGSSVCYDIRFPEFYRLLSHEQPLDLIVVTAAFTWTTGRAHWEILLRARAIENQCWLLASAQGGDHANGRKTWGQSLLIDPWGQIVQQQMQGEGLVCGVVDPHRTRQVRLNLPAHQHRVLA